MYIKGISKKVVSIYMGFPGGSDDKESACNVGDLDLISGSGRSHGEGNGNPLQYSCLEISWTEKPGGLQSIELYQFSHLVMSDTLQPHELQHTRPPCPDGQLLEFTQIHVQ